MNQLPKLKNFEAPQGYFDKLPDQILAKTKTKKTQNWIGYAAAAVLVLGMAIAWQSGILTPKTQNLSSEELALLYIESQVWTAEDILSMAEDPNAILDQIIEEELPLAEELWAEEEPNWF
ncbi:hypothetical protein [Algoriphagus boritolerans]|uniref:Uncharacterized protein n=1 Tax=Algoriphagus boritolerans DSM 17298 = JCM 18970 TaxID=1120964 RepID=A0A1H5VJW9_9BACT|nr:hypothetical protein [Algoriphagus boritolerans]SEF87569.1 hypothetical protein SAMN03080598_01708 [Algoriphagus boritolerans DSM 17298 = JCM 18970]